jgi:glycosyltransferase involved in cell wall biosynthesis
MKIAILSQPADPVRPRGPSSSLAIWAREVSRCLAKGCEVAIFCRREGVDKSVEWDDGVQYRRFARIRDLRIVSGLRWRLQHYGYNPSFIPFWSALEAFSYVLQVAIYLRRHEYDVVHIINYSQFASVIRAINPRLKIVLHMQCEWLTQLNRNMIEARIKNVDLVIGCSAYITDLIRARFPQFADRCHTVFNGVDVKCFSPLKGTGGTKDGKHPRLLFVGRVSPEKGVHVLIEALPKIIERFPEAHLDIVGPNMGSVPYDMNVSLADDEKTKDLAVFYDGRRACNYFPRLEKDLASAHLDAKVRFHDHLSQPDLVKFYQNASVFIFPAVWHEPFGMPVAEAMACELVVVATRSGGITEIVEERKSGLLVERGNPEALAAAICLLLEDEDRCKSMGKAGRKRVLEHFSWETIARQLLELYRTGCPDHSSMEPGKPAAASVVGASADDEHDE